MSSKAEENKAIVRRFEEELAKGNLDIIDELLAPDFVDRALIAGQGPTREDFKSSQQDFLDAFSTTSITIEEHIAEGDTVVTKYRGTGVSRGEFAGIPPKGVEETVVTIKIHCISEGKITEEWSTLDVGPVWEDLARAIGERERVEQELQVARRIQQASLPKEAPALEGWQISPFYQPAREVGGDFYDFHPLSEGRLGLVVGDATSKGVPAALVMASARSMLRAVAQASSSPGDVLGRAAALFYTDGLVEAHDPNAEMFGFPRLRALVAEHDEERSLGDFLMEELYSFVGEGWEQEDDITLLTLKRSASLS